MLPAIERYTGVVYDGLDAVSLPPAARAWVDEHVVIASALFGLLRPTDPVPAYRLSAGTVLPGLPLRSHWSAPVARALHATGEWVLDGRSSAYAALGAAPAGSAVLHVEQVATDGRRRALNHWNKLHKGLLARALAESGAVVRSRDDLLAWAAESGTRLEPRGPQDVTLVVPT